MRARNGCHLNRATSRTNKRIPTKRFRVHSCSFLRMINANTPNRRISCQITYHNASNRKF